LERHGKALWQTATRSFSLGTPSRKPCRSQLDPEIVDSAPGVVINRHCASGPSVIAAGAASIRAEMDRVVIAGGVHSSSLIEWKDKALIS